MIVAREEGRMLQEQLLKKQKKVIFVILLLKIIIVNFFIFFRKLIEVYVHHKYIQQMETVLILSYLSLVLMDCCL